MKGSRVSNWSREQLVAAFGLYCRIPFGQFHSRNSNVIELARAIGRSAGALAMKLCNFATFDPAHRRRNVTGLANASRADKEIWDAFIANPARLALETTLALERLAPRIVKGEQAADEPVLPAGPTEGRRLVSVRRVQGFFRRAVLTSYKDRCAMCGLDEPRMLNASHIIPWRVSEERRADPRNGLALCTFHDRAFDGGLMAVGEDLRLLVTRSLEGDSTVPMHHTGFADVADVPLRLPHRFHPDQDALRHHRTIRFEHWLKKKTPTA